MSQFKLTQRQLEAQELLAGSATYQMLFGGSRSGKTFLLVRNTVMRALKAPHSRHLILRFRFNHVKTSVILDTFPKVMRACFPGVAHEISRTDWYAKFPNGAEIWFAGLDDKDRMEKVLGNEYATIYLNECSQISWAGVELVKTRLAQKVDQVIQGRGTQPLKLRMYFDCNPPSKAHWTYRVFKQKVNPDTKVGLPNPDAYISFQMNPQDNAANLSGEYLETLATLSERMRRRFERGEFADANPSALFDEAIIDRWRVMDGRVPPMVRIVVAVDPSGAGDSDNERNDEIGIAVAGLGTDGVGYVIEDCTVKAGPATWGKVATDAYDRHAANCIVGETNFGGDMVRQTIQTARPNTPFKRVVASRGKAVRAEPFSALYETGKVRHIGILAKLEDELCAFSSNGYVGNGSPNRADAVIWALAELFPSLTAAPRKERPERERYGARAGSWMG